MSHFTQFTGKPFPHITQPYGTQSRHTAKSHSMSATSLRDPNNQTRSLCITLKQVFPSQHNSSRRPSVSKIPVIPIDLRSISHEVRVFNAPHGTCLVLVLSYLVTLI